jgi:hypothetical protein
VPLEFLFLLLAFFAIPLIASPPAPLNNNPRKKKPKIVNSPIPTKYQKGLNPPISILCHIFIMANNS